ncbi:TPA: hypothetical protein NJ591_000433 [Vibrio parahaemolyticus]|nr:MULTISPECIES: hypothetical protein [Vibrio]MBE3915447.1 hypothetical protein [Vibrio parahaemolyticus]MBE3919770.1 hypothetical protein [Vibrio parahaemolyticus]MDF5119749.1 hypothetical protein [Vibrio parahaemolyticus]MDF5607683.1 hypothetical protein [Vibrio parahaemolyticus]MDF5622374.1 hypothetical protein [Vibrio parahaemolyticus]
MEIIDSVFAWMDAYEFSLWHLPFWFVVSFIWYLFWDWVLDYFKPYP